MIFKEKWRYELENKSNIKELPYGDDLFKLTDNLVYKLKKKIEDGKFSDINYRSDNDFPNIDNENYAFKMANGDRVFMIDQYDPCMCCGDGKSNSYYYLVKSARRERDIYKCIDCGKLYYSYKEIVNEMIDNYSIEDADKIRNFDCTRHLYLISRLEEDVKDDIRKDILTSLQKAEIYLRKQFY